MFNDQAAFLFLKLAFSVVKCAGKVCGLVVEAEESEGGGDQQDPAAHVKRDRKSGKIVQEPWYIKKSMYLY